jgi:hypothetical protein
VGAGGGVPAEQLGMALNHLANELARFDLAQPKHLRKRLARHMAVLFGHLDDHAEILIKILRHLFAVLADADADPKEGQNNVYSLRLILFVFYKLIN